MGASDLGVGVQIDNCAVVADYDLIAAPKTNLRQLAIAVQATVASVIQTLVGLALREVNVYIQDVEVGHG